MAYSKNVRDQLKNVTAGELIQALKRDGWEEKDKRGGTRGFWKNENGRRRYAVIHYHPKKTYSTRFFGYIEQTIGWTPSDLRRLKLIK